MSKTVLDIGNCGPDHAAIFQLLQTHYDVEVVQAHGLSDALDLMRESDFSLVLVNRIMDRDGSPGIDILQQIKNDSALCDVPVMMISNFAEHQETAIAAGAAPGFGKSELHLPTTVERLRPFLMGD